MPRIANGTVQDHQTGLYVKHKEKLSFSCEPGHVLSEEISAECLNGTYTHLPTCLPGNNWNGFISIYSHCSAVFRSKTCSGGISLRSQRKLRKLVKQMCDMYCKIRTYTSFCRRTKDRRLNHALIRPQRKRYHPPYADNTYSLLPL